MSLILSGSDGLSDVDGSASTPAIRGTDTNTGIFFPAADTIAFAEGGAEVARFDSSGQLGIGTTSPASGLEVKGTGTFPRLTLSDTNIAGSATIGCNDGDLVLTSDSGDAVASSTMNFYIDTTEAMRIDSSGNLLVGSTSTFRGSTRVEITAPTPGDALAVRATTTSSNTQIAFYNPNGVVGSISTSGSTTTYSTSSDYRLKENVAPMTDALAVVGQLKPCTYTWKVDGSDGQGFIAHELQEVVPECVTGEKDAVNEDGTIKAQGIDTSFLVATLTAAIQEQQAIITDLKSRIETLEAK
jgi:hypothetical protein